jgi:hypothetical protein
VDAAVASTDKALVPALASTNETVVPELVEMSGAAADALYQAQVTRVANDITIAMVAELTSSCTPCSGEDEEDEEDEEYKEDKEDKEDEEDEEDELVDVVLGATRMNTKALMKHTGRGAKNGDPNWVRRLPSLTPYLPPTLYAL